MAQVGLLTDTGDRWRTSDQKPRWVTSAVPAIAPRVRRINGDRHLPRLQAAPQADIQAATGTEPQISSRAASCAPQLAEPAQRDSRGAGHASDRAAIVAY